MSSRTGGRSAAVEADAPVVATPSICRQRVADLLQSVWPTYLTKALLQASQASASSPEPPSKKAPKSSIKIVELPTTPEAV